MTAGPEDWKGDRLSDDPIDRAVWQLNQIRQILLFVLASATLGALFVYATASTS